MATQADWEAKLEEIVVHIAGTLFGAGPYNDAQLAEARDEAEDAVEEWERATLAHVDPLIPSGPLQRLLAEQHDIAEAIGEAEV